MENVAVFHFPKGENNSSKNKITKNDLIHRYGQSSSRGFQARRVQIWPIFRAYYVLLWCRQTVCLGMPPIIDTIKPISNFCANPINHTTKVCLIKVIEVITIATMISSFLLYGPHWWDKDIACCDLILTSTEFWFDLYRGNIEVFGFLTFQFFKTAMSCLDLIAFMSWLDLKLTIFS